MYINADTHVSTSSMAIIVKLKAKYLLTQPPHPKCFLEMDIRVAKITAGEVIKHILPTLNGLW